VGRRTHTQRTSTCHARTEGRPTRMPAFCQARAGGNANESETAKIQGVRMVMPLQRVKIISHG